MNQHMPTDRETNVGACLLLSALASVVFLLGFVFWSSQDYPTRFAFLGLGVAFSLMAFAAFFFLTDMITKRAQG